ncbi:hypothetical protein PTE30175_01286 [Pandoraea terrae]|uniref:Lipoprotein n=1 Tax=Pandoraea terrae TaxID=1537710 RepID=A0A5E4TBN4_9BURK|nr:hypothetical protein [Pandoraea terrae]VVD85596.1 hypothetical protein PTE30175_01286 [Pandoraea terrae]
MKLTGLVLVAAAMALTTTSAVHAAGSANHKKEAPKLFVDMGAGCAIRITDPFGGHLASNKQSGSTYWTDKPPIKTKISRFILQFYCDDLTMRSKAKVALERGGVYDEKLQRWEAHYASEWDAEGLRPVTTIRALNAVNGSGFYLTQDDTDGDEWRRERYLSFCLFHGTKAMCGGENVMRLEDPKGNLLPYYLKILRSIEFVDPPAASPAPASGPASQDHTLTP